MATPTFFPEDWAVKAVYWFAKMTKSESALRELKDTMSASGYHRFPDAAPKPEMRIQVYGFDNALEELSRGYYTTGSTPMITFARTSRMPVLLFKSGKNFSADNVYWRYVPEEGVHEIHMSLWCTPEDAEEMENRVRLHFESLNVVQNIRLDNKEARE